MLRRIVPLSLLALLAAAAPAQASRSARVVRLHCTRGLTPEDRSVTFEGRIAAIRGAERMQMRFVLQARRPDERWSRIEADGFGTWITAPSGLDRYLYDKTVEGLLAPARYRARVDFRWRDASGEVIRRLRRRSRPCRQPDPRPNLSAGELSVRPTLEPGRRRYVAAVVNVGRGDAGPFEVDFTREGTLIGAVQVSGLPAGRDRRIEIPGVACTAGEQIAVVVDATHEVDESDEADNVLSATCRPT